MEIKRAVNAVQVDQVCDFCKVGNMRPTGVMLDQVPFMYAHACNNQKGCSHTESYFTTYPKIEYV